MSALPTTTDGLQLPTIRDCALEIAEAMTQIQQAPARFLDIAEPACRRLLERPDLLTLGFPISTHRSTTRLLHADGNLTFVIGHEPPAEPIPVHDHGMWEILGLYQGALDHTLYRRLDDGSRPGRADLETVERRAMSPGDVVLVPPPPNDLHGFTPLTRHTYLVAILPGWYADQRRYFDIERGTYYFQGRTPV
jgi:predicted metal-dependent enzyme (double-stranded beta helix superfamily)